MITIVGNHVSPYVRKVLAALELKRLPYRIDPIVPFLGDARFSTLSPLRRIPVLIDPDAKGGDLTLPDSTAIGEYLDDLEPEPPLRPAGPADRARMRWLEEFADTRLGHVIVGRLFFAGLVGPKVLGLAKDEAALTQAAEVELPAALAQLEAILGPGAGFAFGNTPTLGDLAAGAMLQMLAMMRRPLNADRFPRAASLLAAVEALPEMAKLMPAVGIIMANPPGEQRAALAAAGVPVVPDADSVLGPAPLPRVAV